MIMVDPRLLRILIVISEERSVTRAAERLNVSQPALSTSLRRLREEFGDPLFVRAGKELVPTDRAVTVLDQAKEIMQRLQAISQASAPFDPGTDSLSLNIEASEYTHQTVLPRLMSIIARDAPLTRINMRPLDYGRLGIALENGTLDFAILPEHLAPKSLKMRKLFDEEFVCLMRRGHPLAQNALSATELASYPHIRVAPVLTQGQSPVDAAFKRAGLSREIALSVTSYASVPQIVASTDLVAFFPASMVDGLDHRFVVLSSPFHAGRTTMSLIWHPRKHDSLAHRWARQTLAKAAQAPPGTRDSGGGSVKGTGRRRRRR